MTSAKSVIRRGFAKPSRFQGIHPQWRPTFVLILYLDWSLRGMKRRNVSRTADFRSGMTKQSPPESWILSMNAILRLKDSDGNLPQLGRLIAILADFFDSTHTIGSECLAPAVGTLQYRQIFNQE